MYDTLLFLHILMAVAMFVTLVMFSGFVLGGPVDRATLSVANFLWAIGGLGTLVLGVWLAIYVDGYEVWDLWIVGAIVLWALAAESGRRAEMAVRDVVGGGGSATAIDAGAVRMHWIRVALVVALLIVMIYKPGA